MSVNTVYVVSSCVQCHCHVWLFASVFSFLSLLSRLSASLLPAPFFTDAHNRCNSHASVISWVPLKPMPHSRCVAFTPFSLTKGTFQSAEEREHEVIIGDGLELSLPVLKGKLLVNVVANVHNKLPSKSCRIVYNTGVVTNSLNEIK